MPDYYTRSVQSPNCGTKEFRHICNTCFRKKKLLYHIGHVTVRDHFWDNFRKLNIDCELQLVEAWSLQNRVAHRHCEPHPVSSPSCHPAAHIHVMRIAQSKSPNIHLLSRFKASHHRLRNVTSFVTRCNFYSPSMKAFVWRWAVKPNCSTTAHLTAQKRCK